MLPVPGIRISDLFLVLGELYKKGSARMALTKEKKQEIIKKFAKSKNDTGSAEVQIAILTEEINNLT